MLTRHTSINADSPILAPKDWGVRSLKVCDLLERRERPYTLSEKLAAMDDGQHEPSVKPVGNFYVLRFPYVTRNDVFWVKLSIRYGSDGKHAPPVEISHLPLPESGSYQSCVLVAKERLTSVLKRCQHPKEQTDFLTLFEDATKAPEPAASATTEPAPRLKRYNSTEWKRSAFEDTQRAERRNSQLSFSTPAFLSHRLSLVGPPNWQSAQAFQQPHRESMPVVVRHSSEQREVDRRDTLSFVLPAFLKETRARKTSDEKTTKEDRKGRVHWNYLGKTR